MSMMATQVQTHHFNSLFHELRNRFPEVPEEEIKNLMVRHGNNRDHCIQALGIESNRYLYGGTANGHQPSTDHVAAQVHGLNLAGGNSQRSQSGSSGGGISDFRQRSDSADSHTSVCSAGSAGGGHGRSTTTYPAQPLPPLTHSHSVPHYMSTHNQFVSAPKTAPPTTHFEPFLQGSQSTQSQLPQTDCRVYGISGGGTTPPSGVEQSNKTGAQGGVGGSRGKIQITVTSMRPQSQDPQNPGGWGAVRTPSPQCYYPQYPTRLANSGYSTQQVPQGTTQPGYQYPPQAWNYSPHVSRPGQFSEAFPQQVTNTGTQSPHSQYGPTNIQSPVTQHYNHPYRQSPTSPPTTGLVNQSPVIYPYPGTPPHSQQQHSQHPQSQQQHPYTSAYYHTVSVTGQQGTSGGQMTVVTHPDRMYPLPPTPQRVQHQSSMSSQGSAASSSGTPPKSLSQPSLPPLYTPPGNAGGTTHLYTPPSSNPGVSTHPAWMLQLPTQMTSPPDLISETDPRTAGLAQQPIQPVPFTPTPTGSEGSVGSPAIDFTRGVSQSMPYMGHEQTKRSSNISEDQRYTQALVLHQRARMEKLLKDYQECLQMLDKIRSETDHLERLSLQCQEARTNTFPSAEDVRKMRENNRTMQIDIQLLTHEKDMLDSGDMPLGLLDPKEMDGFYMNIQPGQRGSIHSTTGDALSALLPPMTRGSGAMSMPHFSTQTTTTASSRAPPARPPPPIFHLPPSHPPPPPHMVGGMAVAAPNSPVQVTQPRIPPSVEDDDEANMWSCAACTFRNHPALDKCEVCEMPRVNVGGRPR